MTRVTDFLIIGGGLAGATAAETLRKEGAEGSIAIISAESSLPYHRPPLTKHFLLGKQKKENIRVLKESYYRTNKIDLILGTKALTVNPEGKIVTTDNGGEFHFKRLLLATGCSPIKLDMPGAKLAGIYYLRTVTDAEALMRAMKSAKKAVVVGGSFISMELASSFTQKGIRVTIVTKEDILFDKLASPEVSDFFTEYYKDMGVEVTLGETIREFKGKDKVNRVITSTGKSFSCDFVAVGVGVAPDVNFLRGSGIKVDDGIVVDEFMRTNKPDIYAAGDVAKFFDPLFLRHRRIEHWDNAIKQGWIAAKNMMGEREHYCAVSYFFSDVFDLSFNFFGSPEDTEERVIRGSMEEKSFSVFYLKDHVLRAAFMMRRPPLEVKMAESLIHNRVNLKHEKGKLPDTEYPLEKVANQTALILQGGGAVGAFECGVIRAMEEKGIYPDIVAGVSIGAFNAAIIVGNPKNATPALQAFWEELAVVNPPHIPNEEMRRFLSSLHTLIFGSPKFFRPRWFMPIFYPDKLPLNWMSFYDPSPVKKLLRKYVDFERLMESPIRLLVSAVDVETAELRTFDSHRDRITPDHILASGSLPPGFPWTTIDGKHYWDGGIVSNTPLEPAIELCGSTVRKAYIVDLYSRTKSLPTNMAEILARRDEILYSEKIRNDIRTRGLINNYKKLVEEIMGYLDPAAVNQIKQRPRYIQTMGHSSELSIIRMIHEGEEGELPSKDYDFSMKSIEDHIKEGYKVAKEVLSKEDAIYE
ncbi:MAG TPA: FAD-dependent oxidoreductase [Thermodesulfobacteriota bacterium]|nr:FAD-dependent oxidoreductase [Thermodesulfobacteriota bacterium]